MKIVNYSTPIPCHYRPLIQFITMCMNRYKTHLLMCPDRTAILHRYFRDQEVKVRLVHLAMMMIQCPEKAAATMLLRNAYLSHHIILAGSEWIIIPVEG